MKVVAAINGSISAELMTFYAMKYAQAQNFSLVLLHIKNAKDDDADVESSAKRVSTFCEASNVETQFIVLEGSSEQALRDFFETTNNIDAVFCSTRKRKSLIRGSFSETLIKLNVDADVAVVRIVKMNHMTNVNNILLCIEKDKLSVKKFTFFSTLISAYKTEGEIYSVTNLFTWQLSRIDIRNVREKLSAINFHLRHYVKLALLSGFSLHIKHDFTEDKFQSILAHIVKSDTGLAIIGAKRLSPSNFFQ